MTQTELVLEVYKLWYLYDLGYEDLHMTFNSLNLDEPPRVWLDCSDSFAWGTADSEEVANEHDFGLLVNCLARCQAFNQNTIGWDVSILYAARKRNLMPMPPRMKSIDESLHPLFKGLSANEDWA